MGYGASFALPGKGMGLAGRSEFGDEGLCCVSECRFGCLPVMAYIREFDCNRSVH